MGIRMMMMMMIMIMIAKETITMMIGNHDHKSWCLLYHYFPYILNILINTNNQSSTRGNVPAELGSIPTDFSDQDKSEKPVKRDRGVFSNHPRTSHHQDDMNKL